MNHRFAAASLALAMLLFSPSYGRLAVAAASIGQSTRHRTRTGTYFTGRSQAHALAASGDPVTTRHGLVLLPDRVIGDKAPLDAVLPALQQAPSARAFDMVLASIAARYGRNTAFGVALDFEYPGVQH